MSTSLTERETVILREIDNLLPSAESPEQDPKLEKSRIELAHAGLIDDLEEMAEGMRGNRHAAVEVGYEVVSEGRFNPIVALRWAPNPEGDGVYSKAVRRVLLFGGLWLTEYAMKIEMPAGTQTIWETLQVRGDLGGETRKSKLRVAMSCANAKIVDNRRFENGVYMGSPGIGKI
ncbi:MAG TPA: hypothetical protein VLG67_02795 [Candidatus Saccharimonadales bacterium]|nr:hypothetical protein [Candidatus Saccharimonadales bacterium]